VVGPINLELLDPPILEQTQFEPDMQRWLSNIVDIINASFMTINNIFANVLAISTIDIGGSGAGPLTVTVVGLTAVGSVTVNLLSSSNPVSISSVVPGTNQFSVTFSADPGASAIIQYIAFTAAP
jgi:hypothetical protein